MKSQNETTIKCSICNDEFSTCDEGVHGYIGIIEFAFCQGCLGGVQDMFEQNHICPECGHFEGSDDGI